MEEKSGVQAGVADLTSRQRECLLFVYEGLSSKEIALKLGLGPGTVDNHIKAGVKAMGAGSRFEAARLLYEASRQDYPKLDSQPPELPTIEIPAHPEAVPQLEEQRDGSPERLVLNDQTPALQPFGWVEEPLRLRLPEEEQRPHDLTLAKTIGQIIAAASLLVTLLLGAGAVMKEVGPAAADVRCFFKPSKCQVGR